MNLQETSTNMRGIRQKSVTSIATIATITAMGAVARIKRLTYAVKLHGGTNAHGHVDALVLPIVW
jgi:hypothetical protein